MLNNGLFCFKNISLTIILNMIPRVWRNELSNFSFLIKNLIKNLIPAKLANFALKIFRILYYPSIIRYYSCWLKLQNSLKYLNASISTFLLKFSCSSDSLSFFLLRSLLILLIDYIIIWLFSYNQPTTNFD